MLSTYRKIINDGLSVRRHSIDELESLRFELEKLEIQFNDNKKVRLLFQQAGVTTQKFIEEHISSIVTKALQAIFHQQDISFSAKFTKKRNQTECSLTILDDGENYDILEDKGFGIADTVSFALRVAYLLLDSVDKVLIIDEPFRCMDAEKAQYVSRMISELSRRLDIQFIIVSHIQELVEHADRVFQVKMTKGISNVKQVK